MMRIAVSGKAGSGKDEVCKAIARRMEVAVVGLGDPMKRFLMELYGWSEETLWGPSYLRDMPDLTRKRACNKCFGTGVVCRQLKTIDMEGTHPAEYETCPACNGTKSRPLTPRWALQQLGDGWGREKVDPLTWYGKVKAVALSIEKTNHRYIRTHGVVPLPAPVSVAAVLVNDLRNPNDVEAMRQDGWYLVRVKRPVTHLDGTDTAKHTSETHQEQVPDSAFHAIITNDSTLEDLGRRTQAMVFDANSFFASRRTA